MEHALFHPHWRQVPRELFSSLSSFSGSGSPIPLLSCPWTATFPRSPGSSSWEQLEAKGWGPGVLVVTQVSLLLGLVTRLKGSRRPDGAEIG